MPPNRPYRKCGFESLESRQLLASDLTLLADINSDLSTKGMSVRKLTKLGSEVYFLSDNPTVGEELWKYNSGSPTLVKNINQGSPSANIGPLTVLGDKLIFSATDQEHGNEIWVSNGTETGTQLLQDISGGGGSSIPSKANTVGNQSLFFAYGRTIYGRLWKTDGSPEGTTMVKQIESDSQSTFNTNLSTAVVGNKLMFVFDDDVHGAELWESDGTAEGTHIAFEFAEGAASFQPNHLISLGNLVLMETNQGIYASDGTLAGTIQLSSEPLSLNGTTEGTRFVKAFAFPIINGGEDSVFVEGKLFLPVYQDQVDRLWSTDGTEAGTKSVECLGC